MLLHCRTRLGSFEIEAARRLGMENIVVLRKRGELVVEDGLAGVSPPLKPRSPSWNAS